MRYDGGKGAMGVAQCMSILERRALMASLAECDDKRSIIVKNGVSGRSLEPSTIAGRHRYK